MSAKVVLGFVGKWIEKKPKDFHLAPMQQLFELLKL